MAYLPPRAVACKGDSENNSYHSLQFPLKMNFKLLYDFCSVTNCGDTQMQGQM